MRDSFPFGLPKGIVYNGYYYVPGSPVDRKAGIVQPAIELHDNSTGLGIILARSFSTQEYQALNFSGRASWFAEAAEKARYLLLSDAVIPDAAPADIEAFANELYRTMRMFHEDRMGSVSPEADARYRAYAARISSLDPEGADSVIDPRSRVRTMQRARDSLDYILQEEGVIGWLSAALDHSRDDACISPVAKRAEGYFQSCRDSAPGSYPVFGDDVLGHIAGCYGDAVIYFSWDDRNPVKILKPSAAPEKKGIRLALPGGDAEYAIAHQMADEKFLAAVDIVTCAMLVNSMPTLSMKGVPLSRFLDVFPIKFEGGEISEARQDSGRAICAALDFPQYAVVDITDPSHVFLMPGGTAEFTYRLSFSGSPRLLSYSVAEKGRQEYYHFFVSGGKVCGFHPVSGQDNSLPGISLSSCIWENYQLLYSVLTDGLKRDSGYVRISTMRENLSQRTMIIGGKGFPRYAERSLIDAYNRDQPPERRLHIGDGMIK